MYSKFGKHDLSLEAFKKGFEKSISNSGLQNFTLANLFLTRGSTFQKLNKIDSAILDYKRAILLYPEKYPTKLMPFFYLGQSYASKGDNNNAIKNYLYFLENENNSDDYNEYRSAANYFLGISYYAEYGKMFDKNLLKFSIKYLSKAFQLNPQKPQPLYFRALVYDLLGDKQNSCADLKFGCELGDKKSCESLLKKCD